MKAAIQINLDDPKDAKQFLRGIRIEGKPMAYVVLESGRKLMVEEMTNDELVAYAREVYIDIFDGKSGDLMDLETENQDQ